MNKTQTHSHVMTLTRRRLLGAMAAAAIAAGSAGGLAGPAWAADGPLAGKVVQFLVPAGQGGGYDLYARMLAPYFEKVTGATVVIENRPGASGFIALNQLARSKPDGLTMMIMPGEAALLGQLTDQPGVAFDLTKITVLGRVAEDTRVVLVRADFPFASLQEAAAKGQQIVFPAMGRLDTLGDYGSTTCEAMALNCKLVTGYAGSKEAALAVMGGEADLIILSDGSAINYLNNDKLKVIATVSRGKSTNFPDLPSVFDQGAIPNEWWIDFRNSITEFGRVLLAPPGMEPEMRDYVRGAWREVLADPDLAKEAAAAQRPLNYGDPAEMEKIVVELLSSLSPDRLEEVKKVLTEKFG